MGHKLLEKKQGYVIYSEDWENKANKVFMVSCFWERKLVQGNERRQTMKVLIGL